jgi:hypothetical protein
MAFDLSESGAFLGREVGVQVALSGSRTMPTDEAFLDIGGTKDLSLSGQWGTVDVTSRSSLGRIREQLLDYVGYSGSFGGNILAEDSSNLRAVRNRCLGIQDVADTPEDATPTAWIRFAVPDEDGADDGDVELITLPINLSQCELNWPDEAAATFNFSFEGRGRVVSEIVPATPAE